MDGRMEGWCHRVSPISPPPSVWKPDPTWADLRVHSFTQSGAHVTTCWLRFLIINAASPQRRQFPHVGDYWVNQITITLFPCIIQGSETPHTSQSLSADTYWKILTFPLEKKIQFAVAPLYWSAHLSLFLSVGQAMISCNSSSLGESSWFQLSEAVRADQPDGFDHPFAVTFPFFSPQ